MKIEGLQKYNKDKINIVIPMAWAWSRFAKAWYELPKPLIDVKWKPMFYWAVSSFDFLKHDYDLQYIFIILSEHIVNYELDKKITSVYPNSIVISLDKITRWQAETVLMVKEYIDNSNKLIIFNSDTYTVFDKDDFPIDNDNIDWLISCFYSDSEKFSYAKLNNLWYVEEVAEKIVISNNATNWMYYFRKWSDFVNYAENMILNENLSGWEFYVWPMYNDLIKDWKNIKINYLKENWILWTPDELDYFLKNYNEN